MLSFHWLLITDYWLLKNPHKLKSLDEIRKILAQRNIKPSDNIIVSCSTGREATLQYVVLKHLLGYPKVRIYEGSWTEYSTTDLPVATGPEKAVYNRLIKDFNQGQPLPLQITTFSRGELPHYAGINTFMKAPYLEDVRNVGNYDVAIVGVPHDSGTTYRPGTRFGPQGIRRISALYTPYNFELGVDLREQITLCDLGDIFTIPANN